MVAVVVFCSCFCFAFVVLLLLLLLLHTETLGSKGSFKAGAGRPYQLLLFVAIVIFVLFVA